MANITLVSYPLMQRLADGDFDFTTAALFGLLCDSNAYTPDFAADFFLTDIFGAGAVELTDGSYARVAVTSPAVSVDSGASPPATYCTGYFDWGSVTGAESYDTAVMFIDFGSDATNEVILVWDLGAQITDGSPIILDGNSLPPLLQLTANF